MPKALLFDLLEEDSFTLILSDKELVSLPIKMATGLPAEVST